MARDEKPYEDERRDPEMTGDVLSPRWTSDAADTDEQPAIVVGGDEVAYVLPPEPAAPPADVLDPPTLSDPHLLVTPSDPHLLVTPSDPHLLATPSDPHLLATQSDPHLLAAPLIPAPEDAGDGEEDEPAYLPLDRGYQAPKDEEDEPKRGFLGSGWMEEPEPDREVRRRTRVLVFGAAGIVLVGLAGGWLMSSSSTVEDCSQGQCVSADRHTPQENPVDSPEPSASTPEGEAEPSAEPSRTPEPTTEQVRATRTPTPRSSPTRMASTATAKPTAKPTGDVQGEIETVDSEPKAGATTAPPAAKQATTAPQATSQTTAPAPQPTETKDEKPGGLLDLLFGWAK